MRWARPIIAVAAIIAVASLGPLSSAQPAADGWPTSGHDQARTARSSAVGPAAPRVLWRRDIPERFSLASNKKGGTLSRDGRTLFVAAGFDGIVALDAATGAIRWRRNVEEGVGASPCPPFNDSNNEKWVGQPPTVLDDGTLFAPTEYGWALALHPDDGRLLWRVHSCKTEQAAAYDGERVYFGSWDGYFYAYDASPSAFNDGRDESAARLRWRHQFATITNRTHWSNWYYTYGAPAYAGGAVYFAWKGVWAFEAATGRLLWRRALPERIAAAVPFWGPSIGPDGRLFVASDRSVYGVAPDGRSHWTANLGGPVGGGPPAVAAGGATVYHTVASGNDAGHLVALNAANGAVRWRFGLGCGGVQGGAAVDGAGTVYALTDCDGGAARLHAVNPDGTYRWHIDFDAGRIRFGGHRDLLIALGGDGTLYLPSAWAQIVAVGDASAPPTPTASPTATPTATPQPTATATPSPTPTPAIVGCFVRVRVALDDGTDEERELRKPVEFCQP